MNQLSTWALCGALCSSASAQSFDFALDQGLSTTDLTSGSNLALPANAIGSYDAAANPTGTITCTSIFGACANTTIPMSTALIASSSFVGVPTGTFRASVDAAAGVIVISDLAVDALGGQNGTTDLTLELSYQTFRTQQPSSLYVGGFTLPLPLGQAVASNVRFAQLGPAVPGALTATAIPDVYDVAALVPATLSFDVDFLGNALTVGPVPLALPLVGSLDLGGGNANIALFVDQTGMQTLVDPLGAQTFDDVPLDLPTILPPGEVAHLVFDIDPGDLVFDFSASLEWFASGAPACDTQGYCVSTPNTFGAGARMASSGSTSMVFNDFVLSCDGVPPFHPGRFCFGSKQALAPLGDGILCIGGLKRRFKVVFADAQGVTSLPVDFLDPTQPAGLITPGSTWNFQLVYRDPLGGAATFNTSDALEVTFCP